MKSGLTDEACTVLHALADGIYITDTERRILFWNRRAEAMTGWTAKDIEGRSCFDNVLAHEDLNGNPLCGQELCPLHRAIITGQSSTLPAIVFAKGRDGRRIPVEVTVGPIRDSAGRITGGIESFRDLSPLMVDLERARRIQDHAMRDNLPSDPRLEIAAYSVPRDLIGGDFYRMEPVGENRMAVLLADVMGHGVPAALYTMQIRCLWEEARPMLADPGRFMAHMNRILSDLTHDEDFFATAFLGLLDLDTLALQYVNAGHPAPGALRNGGFMPLPPTAPAVGLLPDADFGVERIALAPGELLLLYTDGAPEAVNLAGEELGAEGWARMLTAWEADISESALARLETALLEYTGQLTLTDDLTLIALRPTAR